MNQLTFNKDARPVNRATILKMANRIEHWLGLATGEELEQGLSWYFDAQCFCSVIAQELNFKAAAVAQTVAILSPQIDWETNKANAVLIATSMNPSIKIFATRAQKEKALAALAGEYTLGESSRKTYSFADNIANPDSTRVTVDRHATKVALNDRTADQVRITTRMYRDIEKAYQLVAEKRGLMPYQVQAIAWVTYKRVVGR